MSDIISEPQHIIRAVHDTDHPDEGGYIEIIVKGGTRDDDEVVINAVISLYESTWGVTPDRIYSIEGSIPAGEDENKKLIWPDWETEDTMTILNPPEFLDRLTAARTARDPEFPTRAELQEKLRAEREPACFDPSDPENMATEQLIERIDELEKSKGILLDQRARLAATNDALQDELNLASQAAQKDAADCGRQQITDAAKIDDLEAAFQKSQQACKNFRRSIIEFEHTNKMLSARILRLENENADGKANRNEQAAQILALDDACKRWEERAQAIKLEAALAEIGRSGAEAGLDAAEKLNRAIGALNDVHGYCDQLENYLPKKARKRMEKECGNYWADKLLFVLPEPVQFTGFPPLIPNGATGQGDTLLGPVSFNKKKLERAT